MNQRGVAKTKVIRTASLSISILEMGCQDENGTFLEAFSSHLLQLGKSAPSATP